jgi:mannose PTS system EIIA component
MNSVLIIAHAPLAHALREIALHVFPDASAHIAALDVQSDARPEDTLKLAEVMLSKLAEAVRKDAKNGCLLLCDVLGATPCNVATQLAVDPSTKLVTGVNVPMLLRAMTYRHEPLEQLAARAVAGGIQGVMAVAMTAPQHQTQKPQLNHDQNQHDHQQ